MSDSLRPHGTPGFPVHHQSPQQAQTHVHWVTISSFVVPFSSHLQSFPAAVSFPVSQFFASGGQRTGASASASVLSMNIQDWFPLGWTGLISLQSKGLSRVFSNTTVQKNQFFGTQPSLWMWSSSHMITGKAIALIIWTFVGKVMCIVYAYYLFVKWLNTVSQYSLRSCSSLVP